MRPRLQRAFAYHGKTALECVNSLGFWLLGTAPESRFRSSLTAERRPAAKDTNGEVLDGSVSLTARFAASRSKGRAMLLRLSRELDVRGLIPQRPGKLSSEKHARLKSGPAL
jgi:hypothetical protein